MVGEEASDKVKRANDIRYLEYVKFMKIERGRYCKILVRVQLSQSLFYIQ